MAEVIVDSTAQSDVEAAILSAGNDGTVIFPEGNYATDSLIADKDDQLWVMKKGAKFQANGPAVMPWLRTMCSGLEIQGGDIDLNGNHAAIYGVGSNLKWTGGTIHGGTTWGIVMDDGFLELDLMRCYDLGLAFVHWRAMTLKGGAYRDGPIVTRCKVNRRTNYLSSGGILVNSGGGTLSCFRARVQDCDIVMPMGEQYDNVAVEFNRVELGLMTANNLDGSRIGLSGASCSQLNMSNNNAKNVANYAHELASCEWSNVIGNQASGLGYTTSGIGGIVMSGSARSNMIVANVMKQGFPVAVRDVSTWVSGYPCTVGSNL